MKITREVNGQLKVFELTWNEMVKAFVIMQHGYDKETIQWYMDCTGVDIPEDKMDEIADTYREMYDEYLDNCSDARYDFARDAVREVLGNDD